MTHSRLHEDHRYRLLMEVISETLETKGVRGFTISSVAHASGLSRQWVYHFFPDINCVYGALYARATADYFVSGAPAPRDPGMWSEWLVERMSPLLDMRAADAIACNFILNEPSDQNAGVAELRDRMLNEFTAAWSGPCMHSDLSVARRNAIMTTWLSAVFGLSLALSRGSTDRECAQYVLTSLVNCFITTPPRLSALAL